MIALHETGHALDESDVYEEVMNAQRRGVEGEQLALYGGIAAPAGLGALAGKVMPESEEKTPEEKSKLGLPEYAGLATGVGVGTGMASGKQTERLEDTANDFVKKIFNG